MFVETEARPQGEVQTVEQANRKLKLSEAIRIGAKIRPQGKYRLFEGGRSCALGALIEGRGGMYDESAGCKVLLGFAPEFRGHDDLNRLGVNIFHMNDAGMTREDIADWLEAQGY